MTATHTHYMRVNGRLKKIIKSGGQHEETEKS